MAAIATGSCTSTLSFAHVRFQMISGDNSSLPGWVVTGPIRILLRRKRRGLRPGATAWTGHRGPALKTFFRRGWGGGVKREPIGSLPAVTRQRGSQQSQRQFVQSSSNHLLSKTACELTDRQTDRSFRPIMWRFFFFIPFPHLAFFYLFPPRSRSQTFLLFSELKDP